MNDFFNSLGNSLYDSLCNLDLSLHNTKLKDTFIDDFMHELRDYLIKSDVIYRLSKLPQDIFDNFWFNLFHFTSPFNFRE